MSSAPPSCVTGGFSAAECFLAPERGVSILVFSGRYSGSAGGAHGDWPDRTAAGGAPFHHERNRAAWVSAHHSRDRRGARHRLYQRGERSSQGTREERLSAAPPREVTRARPHL